MSEKAQFNDQIPPAQDVSSDQPVMDNDLGAIGPRSAKRQCGTPNKLQYQKLGNPLTLVIQSLPHHWKNPYPPVIGPQV